MQFTVKYLFKTLIKGLLISILICAVMVSIEMLYGRTVVLNAQFSREIAYYCIYGMTLTLINASFFDFLYFKVTWARFGKYKILIGAFVSVFLTLIGIFFIRMFISVALEGQKFADFLTDQKVQNYFISLVITLIVSLCFHAFYFYKKTQDNKVKEQKIIAGTASAKFESLKNQIDPHFLFNSLNVLSSLIEENPENAQKFTTSLSKIYRYVLEQKDKELVSIDEELAFAKTYMNLLKMRFENSLFYELPKGEINPDAKVVPLSLQLLLENTVKHNIVSESRPLHIRIYIENDYLCVENDYQKKEVLQDRQGVGLQNIVSRYAIITNRNVLVDQTEKTFAVKIPILTKQILETETEITSEQSDYSRAYKRMEDIKGFYGNLGSYLVVMTGLAAVNFISTPEYLWFLFPAIGWGIGVLIHGLSIFSNVKPFLGKAWEEKKIQELIEREQMKKWN